jgi:hypothetical protein
MIAFAAVPATAVPATAAPTAAMSAAGPRIVPLPAVTYLPRTADSYPFDAANKETTPVNLSAYRYTEREYLVSGTSNVYEWTGAGLGVAVRNADPVGLLPARRLPIAAPGRAVLPAV